MQRWFLSYNSQDLGLMQGLEAALRRKDPDAQIFFAPKSLRAGGYWLPTLAEEISQATAFVLLVGDKGLGPWQVVEYYEALDKRVKSPEFSVVLVLLEGQSAPGLPFLRQLHWIITADPGSEQAAARLMDAAAGGGSRPGELWRYTSPYRGLAAMTEADSDFFFGRQRVTIEVLTALGATSEKLPVLLGNSGVGKSSLAQAGVLAALKRQAWPDGADASGAWPQAFHDSRHWCYLTLKPGAEPLKALVGPFLDIWQYGAADPERLLHENGWIELLREGKAMLRDLLDATERRYQELNLPKPPAFFIYVDQGEELYVRSEERQRRRFSKLLAEGLDDPRIHVLMSLRADFLGALQNDEALYAVHHKIDVPPLREAELCEVISRPAALLSARFDTDGLAADIARRAAEESAKDAGALPLLSYLLDDMWTQMVNRGDGVLRLPAQAMELGGVLAERANAFLARHPKAEETLRRVLTLKLATVREDGEPTRRLARRSEFTDEEWRLVSELADHPHRLLVTATPERGETHAEVAHEAIFRRWEKLREWMAAEREFLVWRSGLEANRRSWEQTPEHSRDDALLMGLALGQAQSWLAKRAEDLPKVDREFIDLSMRRDALERHKRDSLRRRMFGTAITALAVVTLLALFSFFQWREAESQRREAVKQEQTAQKERDRAGQAVATFIIQLFAASTGAEGAIKDLDEAISLDPTDATSYFLRAVLYSLKKDYDRVIADLDHVILINPNLATGYYFRGSAYENKQDYDRAFTDYDQAIKLDPKNGFSYNGRGFASYNKQNYDRAIADYDEAIRLNSKHAVAYNNRGNAYYAKKEYDRALADYSEAIRLDPNYTDNYFWHNNRGNTYYAKQEYDRALADYSEAIRLDPNNADTYFWYHNRGNAYSYGKQDYDRAIADYDQAVRLNPNYAIAYNDRGNAYVAKKDYDRALADYSEAIRLDPNYALAYANRGFAHFVTLDYDRAIADYDQAIRFDPKNAVSYNNRGSAYRAKGNYDRAIPDLDQAIMLDPNSSRFYYNRGNVYRARGDVEKTAADYAQAIKLGPGDAGAFSAICWRQMILGELESALAECDKSLRLRPGDAYALESHGFAYLKRGQPDNAVVDFDAAVKIESKLASALYGRGLAKLEMNDRAGANADMTAAKAIKSDIANDLARYGVR